MPPEKSEALVEALLERHGRTYAEELGIHVEKNTPSPLFQLLCASLLFSARISAAAAMQAHQALRQAGWTTPEKMARAGWSERTQVLNRHGYARYDESTSRMLGETAQHLLDRYGGDLRRLREEARNDPQEERRRIKEFKGIGDVGADIFCREVQLVWPELYPFADGRSLEGARELGLPADPQHLAGLVEREHFPRLVDALVRMQLTKDQDRIKASVH
jgi:endonuclease III